MTGTQVRSEAVFSDFAVALCRAVIAVKKHFVIDGNLAVARSFKKIKTP